MKKLYLVLIFTLFFACSQEEGKITEGEFIEIYREVLVARESVSDRDEGTSKVNEVFEKHNITEPEFRKYYEGLMKENPRRLAIILDSIRNLTLKEIKEIDSTINAQLEVEKDTSSTTDSM